MVHAGKPGVGATELTTDRTTQNTFPRAIIVHRSGRPASQRWKEHPPPGGGIVRESRLAPTRFPFATPADQIPRSTLNRPPKVVPAIVEDISLVRSPLLCAFSQFRIEE
jgi:hypothetical protein